VDPTLPAEAGWTPPPWLVGDPAGRGGRLDAGAAREPKARHGRRQTRRLWALADPAVNADAGSSGEHRAAWPHRRQVRRVERTRIVVRRGRAVKAAVEVSDAVTSAPPERADAASLLRDLRGHWGIENRSHGVRDVTFDADRCQVRSGAAPQAVAACRNRAVALLRRRGHPNIAAALRTHAARPHLAVSLVLSGGFK